MAKYGYDLAIFTYVITCPYCNESMVLDREALDEHGFDCEWCGEFFLKPGIKVRKRVRRG